MNSALPSFREANVLVVGDLMLDRYWHGDAERISPEAPVPVVRVTRSEDRAGAAGNVATNVTSLGGKAAVVGFVGDDDTASRLEELLAQSGVRHRLTRVPSRQTPTKVRVLSQNQQLLRLDFEAAPEVPKRDLPQAAPPPSSFEGLSPLIEQAGVVILSDYGKGGLPHCAETIRRARALGRPVLVDPWGEDFSSYRGATLMTPNRREMERVVGPWQSDLELVAKAGRLIEELELEAILVTLGPKGMSLISRARETLHLPAQAREVYDVTGAGDTVVAVLGAALATGCELGEATLIANLAAGVVVGKLGAASVAPYELRRSLARGGLGAGGTILDPQELDSVLARARRAGESIVMTNGCFDVLHAGHVAYLEQARQLGDRLLVAVNDDDSVRRLKGERRPIHRLEQRLRVLAALSSIDWLVSFPQDTPEELLHQVAPEVLVKGGDLKPEEVVGRDWVLSQGGRVEVLGFEEGCSTSAILDSLGGLEE
ncbi:MAG: bifunctional D-glycero-beta-D-manno-heptose-7-phosphate kinase/D-glycero-beta-D-manno-heptose 1-phosphate adenylyltransferase HldE [Deltaproteobacteria bacterium]|nr:bifunctional D-glycero-beta-D-manno-heptose-7-phosphate kinase/D-glycero-beta-D-manno-heptose 1-phosphate adenylyltransferase HldE [Deltaproteobacteria bacterium]